jgi:uncharacterized protein YjbI with pentapeptide repeats
VYSCGVLVLKVNASDICMKPMTRGLCGRPAQNWTDTGEHCCICHSHFVRKRRDLFDAAIARILKDQEADNYDFTGFVFPRDWIEFGVEEFEKPVAFTNTVFQGEVRFRQLFVRRVDFGYARFDGKVEFCREHEVKQFQDEVSFRAVRFMDSVTIRAGFGASVGFEEAKFNGNCELDAAPLEHGASFCRAQFQGTTILGLDSSAAVDFSESHVSGPATFRGSIFRRGIDLSYAEFDGNADFTYCIFGESEALADRGQTSFFKTRFKRLVDFEIARINHEMDFRSVVFDTPKRVYLVGVDLSNTRLSRCNLSEIQIHSVSWNRSKCKWWHANRNKVFDEARLFEGRERPASREFQSVAHTYRRLQANYGDSYRYPEAGDFYIGEQEMLRQAKGKFRRYFCWHFAYLLVSRYGESFKRPLLLIVAMTVLSSSFLMLTGIELQAYGLDTAKTIDYRLDLSVTGISRLATQSLLEDFGRIYFANIRL